MKNIYFLLIIGVFCSCKEDFLDAKPSTEIVVPTTLDDCQRLMENTRLNITSALAVLSADEYVYRSAELWQGTNTASERNAFIWAEDLFEGETERRDWNDPYISVFYANSVLNALETIIDADKERYDFIKGWALFVRSFAFFDLARNFAPAYDKSDAEVKMGIPLRLTADVDKIEDRSTLAVTYAQIISDLEQASVLIPAGVPARNRNRPSKEAVFGLLSRVYLNMRDYSNALLYAEYCLSLYDQLIDYNSISHESDSPFLMDNDEVIFQAEQQGAYAVTAMGPMNPSISVSDELLAIYEDGDIRKQVYFGSEDNVNYYFKRGYNQLIYSFSGIAVDEIMLIKAECLVRDDRRIEALQTLNKLLEKRYTRESFVPVVMEDKDQLLDFVLQERRKELVWRGHRWFDLIRLNKEGRDISITRILDGKEYVLPAGDNRWVFPIPDDEIAISGIPQNKR